LWTSGFAARRGYKQNKAICLSYLPVDHGNQGSFDLHAGGHSNVEQLMIEAGVDDGLEEEQSGVQVTFPDLSVVILGERYQRPSRNTAKLHRNQNLTYKHY